jgi:hypothetical protein
MAENGVLSKRAAPRVCGAAHCVVLWSLRSRLVTEHRAALGHEVMCRERREAFPKLVERELRVAGFSFVLDRDLDSLCAPEDGGLTLEHSQECEAVRGVLPDPAGEHGLDRLLQRRDSTSGGRRHDRRNVNGWPHTHRLIELGLIEPLHDVPDLPSSALAPGVHDLRPVEPRAVHGDPAGVDELVPRERSERHELDGERSTAFVELIEGCHERFSLRDRQPFVRERIDERLG